MSIVQFSSSHPIKYWLSTPWTSRCVGMSVTFEGERLRSSDHLLRFKTAPSSVERGFETDAADIGRLVFPDVRWSLLWDCGPFEKGQRDFDVCALQREKISLYLAMIMEVLPFPPTELWFVLTIKIFWKTVGSRFNTVNLSGVACS
jgi:hypothetical protein